MLTKPDERTLKALMRLRPDADFHEFLAWIEYSLAELDRHNRSTVDGVQLRQQQGAAMALSEIVARAQGKQLGALPVRTPEAIRDGLR